MMDQRRGLLNKGKMRVRGKEDGTYLGCGRSGFQDLVAAQTQLAMVLRLNFALTGLNFTTTTLSM